MKILLLILLMMSVPVLASEGWFENNVSIEDNHWRKHDGPFKAQLFLVDNPTEVYAQWNNGQPNSVKVKQLSFIKAGEHFEAIIFFAGCELDSRKMCVLSGDWKVYLANGSLLGEAKGAPVYANTGPTLENQLLISENGIGLGAQRKHRGYKIQVKVTDEIGNRSVMLERSVTVQ